MTRPKLTPAVLFVLLAASLACGSLPGFITRTTPTAAASATPEAAPTETPTAAPTATATPVVTVAPGVTLVKLSDGSTVVVDGDAGYRLTLPPKWLALQLGQEDVQSILDLALAKYPEEANLFEAFTASSVEARAFAFDLAPNHVKNDILPAIIVALDAKSAPIALDLLVQSTVRLVPQVVKGSEILSSDTGENAGGLPIGIVEVKVPLTRDEGEPGTLYEKIVLFRTPSAAVLVTLAVVDELKADLVPVFDAAVDTIQVAEP